MENMGPIPTWLFVWIVAKAFMIGECKIEQKIVQNPIFKKLVLGTYQFHTLCVKQPMEEMTYLSH
jgi:hypothetical protein